LSRWFANPKQLLVGRLATEKKNGQYYKNGSTHFNIAIAHNGFQLQEVGDFEALNCLPAQNLIQSTKLH
jgi:hypothetical protein